MVGSGRGTGRRDRMIPAAVEPLVAELVARCHFPEPGTRVHCAVSGGPDSSALLVLAAAARCRVTAHHVDHGIRPGSGAEADLVGALAERSGARFVAHVARVEPGSNLEARARQARFAVLPDAVMTGHTLDDRAETIMINLLRGAARTGLAPMRPSERHPIVELRRAETHRLCAQLGIDVVDDYTNRDPVFLRNRVRAELMPMLDRCSGRDTAPVLVRQADVLAAEDELLDGLAAAIDPTDAKAVSAAPVALARRAIRRFVTANWDRGHPPSARSVDKILAVARGTAVSAQIEAGHRVYRRHQRLRLEAPELAS